MTTPKDGPLIHTRGYHAGFSGSEESSNPYSGDQAALWRHGWALGSDEKQEIDNARDESGLGELFEPRD